MMVMIKKLQQQFYFQMMVNFWVSNSKLKFKLFFHFLAFGKDALQMYAEMLDEEETALLF